MDKFISYNGVFINVAHLSNVNFSLQGLTVYINAIDYVEQEFDVGDWNFTFDSKKEFNLSKKQFSEFLESDRAVFYFVHKEQKQ